jgi:transcriptional regulator with XRE-family HTH domain
MKQMTLRYYIEVFRDITQEQAAIESGISRSHLNKILTGKLAAGRPTRVKLAAWGKGKIDLAKLAIIEPKGK